MSRAVWGIAVAALIGALCVGRAAAQDLTPTPDPCPALPATDDPIAPYAYYMGVGEAQSARGDFGSALVAYTCALTLQPDSTLTLTRRGFAYASLNDPERAMNDYDAALTLDEAFIEGYLNRGVLYARLGNFGLAIGDFTLAAALDPTDATPLINRGVVHAIERNFDLALADLEAGLRIAPDHAGAYAALGAVYSALAAQNYQRYLEVSADPRLPAGTPADVLVRVDDSLRTGNASVWLALLLRAS
jgi:tetratricopeptide (TPR) repeat protein